MALQGKYIYYSYNQHDSETILTTVTYPEDLPEGHPDYDKRGTTQEVAVPKIIEVPTVYENCVIGVRTINAYILNSDDDGNKIVNLHYNFRVYASIEDKENHFDENFLEEYSDTTTVDLSTYPNLWEYAYNQIKLSKGGSELTNI